MCQMPLRPAALGMHSAEGATFLARPRDRSRPAPLGEDAARAAARTAQTVIWHLGSVGRSVGRGSRAGSRVAAGWIQRKGRPIHGPNDACGSWRWRGCSPAGRRRTRTSGSGSAPKLCEKKTAKALRSTVYCTRTNVSRHTQSKALFSSSNQVTSNNPVFFNDPLHTPTPEVSLTRPTNRALPHAHSPRTTWSHSTFIRHRPLYTGHRHPRLRRRQLNPRLRRHHHRRHHQASRCPALPRVSTLHSDHILLRRSKGQREWPSSLCHPDGC